MPFLRDLGEEMLSRLDTIAAVERVGPGHLIHRQGKRPDRLVVLLGGWVARLYEDRRGKRETADVMLPVSLLSPADVLFDLATTTDAEALTSARLLTFAAAPFRALAGSETALSAALLGPVLSSVGVQERQIRDLKLKTCAQRLATYLLELAAGCETQSARVSLPFEKRLVAAMLGCSRENLSRSFAALKRRGVETRRWVVSIENVSELRAFAGDAAPPEMTCGQPLVFRSREQPAGARQAPAEIVHLSARPPAAE